MQRKGHLLCLPNLTYRFYACRQLYIMTISEEGDNASPDSGKLFVVDLEDRAGRRRRAQVQRPRVKLVSGYFHWYGVEAGTNSLQSRSLELPPCSAAVYQLTIGRHQLLLCIAAFAIVVVVTKLHSLALLENIDLEEVQVAVGAAM